MLSLHTLKMGCPLNTEDYANFSARFLKKLKKNFSIHN